MRQELQGRHPSFSALLSLESRLVKQLLDGTNLPFGQDVPNSLQVKAFLGAGRVLHLVAGKTRLFSTLFEKNQRQTNQIDCCSFLEHRFIQMRLEFFSNNKQIWMILIPLYGGHPNSNAFPNMMMPKYTWFQCIL